MNVKLMTLHCGQGHDWQRPSQRGKPPRFCPTHAQPKPVAVRVVAESVEGDPLSDLDDYPIVCWVDTEYVEPEPRSAEEIRAADVARANHRIDKLTAALKARGTHISQHAA